MGVVVLDGEAGLDAQFPGQARGMVIRMQIMSHGGWGEFKQFQELAEFFLEVGDTPRIIQIAQVLRQDGPALVDKSESALDFSATGQDGGRITPPP